MVVDDEAGARLAVEHLIALGHRHIAHLAGPLDTDTGQRRLAGYHETLRAGGVEPDALLVEEAGLEIEGGYRATARLLARAPAVSAMFTTNVPVAMGAMAAIREAGLTVPADVSVVSLHDSAYAERTEPPLTTVRMPLREMGREAARRPIELVRGGDGAPPVVLPPVGLQVRRSAAPPGRKRVSQTGRGLGTPQPNEGTRS